MVLVFGTICLDRVHRIPRLPAAGGYVEAEEVHTFMGGEAANTAHALTTWGADVELHGNPIGSSPEGLLLKSLLAEHNLSTPAASVGADESQAPVCDVFVTPDGERTMVGAGFTASDGSMELAGTVFRGGEWFTVNPNMSKTSRAAARAAAGKGMRMYYLDFVRSDEQIAAGSVCQTSTKWVGARGDDKLNLEWTTSWCRQHDSLTILTDGARGCYVCSPKGGAIFLPPFPAATVVDSTGAGDLFRAGMLFCLDQGEPLKKCLEFAAATGSLSCRSLGATEDVPTVGEIKGLIHKYPTVSLQYDLMAEVAIPRSRASD